VTTSDVALAAELATRAGELLLALRDEVGFGEPDVLRKAGDRNANEMLVAALREARPDDAILSEEAADDLGRLDADRVWIVDPLDGTNEYGEEGRTDWAVHVALWQRGGAPESFGLVAGAVALPGLGMTLSTDGPWPARSAPSGPPRLAVSRTRRPTWFDAVAAATRAIDVPLGSAGMKAMSVLLGQTDGYVHSGRMKEWDSAAPVAVAVAAGLHVSRLDGAPLEFNTRERLTLDLLVCHPAVAESLLAATAGLAGRDAAER
jgi:3'(2'), 5'-bisphosphate nucleotidase